MVQQDSALEDTESHFLSVFEDLPEPAIEPKLEDEHDVVWQVVYKFEQEGFAASDWLCNLLDAAFNATRSGIPTATQLIRHRMMNQVRGDIDSYWRAFLAKLRGELGTVQQVWAEFKLDQQLQAERTDLTNHENSDLRTKIAQNRDQLKKKEEEMSFMKDQIELRDQKLAEQRSSFYQEVLLLKNQISRATREETSSPPRSAKTAHAAPPGSKDTVRNPLEDELGRAIRQIGILKEQVSSHKNELALSKGQMDAMKERMLQKKCEAEQLKRACQAEVDQLIAENAKEIARVEEELLAQQHELQETLDRVRRNLDITMTELDETRDERDESAVKITKLESSLQVTTGQLIEVKKELVEAQQLQQAAAAQSDAVRMEKTDRLKQMEDERDVSRSEARAMQMLAEQMTKTIQGLEHKNKVLEEALAHSKGDLENVRLLLQIAERNVEQVKVNAKEAATEADVQMKKQNRRMSVSNLLKTAALESKFRGELEARLSDLRNATEGTQKETEAHLVAEMTDLMAANDDRHQSEVFELKTQLSQLQAQLEAVLKGQSIDVEYPARLKEGDGLDAYLDRKLPGPTPSLAETVVEAKQPEPQAVAEVKPNDSKGRSTVTFRKPGESVSKPQPVSRLVETKPDALETPRAITQPERPRVAPERLQEQPRTLGQRTGILLEDLPPAPPTRPVSATVRVPVASKPRRASVSTADASTQCDDLLSASVSVACAETYPVLNRVEFEATTRQANSPERQVPRVWPVNEGAVDPFRGPGTRPSTPRQLFGSAARIQAAPPALMPPPVLWRYLCTAVLAKMRNDAARHPTRVERLSVRCIRDTGRRLHATAKMVKHKVAANRRHLADTRRASLIKVLKSQGSLGEGMQRVTPQQPATVRPATARARLTSSRVAATVRPAHPCPAECLQVRTNCMIEPAPLRPVGGFKVDRHPGVHPGVEEEAVQESAAITDLNSQIIEEELKPDSPGQPQHVVVHQAVSRQTVITRRGTARPIRSSIRPQTARLVR